MLRGKFIALNVCIRRERSKIINLSFHLKLEKEEQIKFKVSRSKEIKIREEINKLKTSPLKTENQWNEKLIPWKDH